MWHPSTERLQLLMRGVAKMVWRPLFITPVFPFPDHWNF
jgi:hypothetical protein